MQRPYTVISGVRFGEDWSRKTMKVLSGHLKGQNFYMQAGIRPTQNLVRKAVFDLLGQDMTGLSFLDLFAGSGAVGIEAASLGAQRVVFVEKDMRCVETLMGNLQLLGLGSRVASGASAMYPSYRSGAAARRGRPGEGEDPGSARPVPEGLETLNIEVMTGDVLGVIKQLSRRKDRFDVVFADPPYERGAAKKTLKTLGAYDIVQPNSHVIIESGKREFLPEESEGGFSRIRHRQYGKSWLSVYERHSAERSHQMSPGSNQM